jgi:hypothetical protein
MLENRLHEATGLSWKIANLGFCSDAVICLTSREVIIGDEPSGEHQTSITLRKVRLRPQFAILFGRAGNLSIAADELNGNISFDRSRPDPSDGQIGLPDSLLKNIRVVHASLEAIGVQFQKASNRLALVSRAMDATFELAPSPGGTEVTLKMGSSGYSATIKAVGTLGAWPLPFSVMLEPRNNKVPQIHVQAQLLSAREGWQVQDIEGSVEQASFSGHASLRSLNEPNFTGQFHLRRLALEGNEVPSPRAGDMPVLRTSAFQGIDLSAFDWLRLNVDWEVDELLVGRAQADHAAGRLLVADGTLDLTGSSSSVYKGSVRFRYFFEGSHQLSVSVSKIRLSLLLQDMLNASPLDGMTTARIDVRAERAQSDKLLSSAVGNAEVSIEDGRLETVKIANLAGAGKGILDTVGLGMGDLRFTRLNGTFSIVNGQAVTSDLHLASSLIDVKGAGFIDFDKRAIDITLRPGPSLERDRKAPTVNIPIRMWGPWDRLTASADISHIMDHPAETMQTLQDLGSRALGKNGDLGGFFDFLNKGAGGANSNRPAR